MTTAAAQKAAYLRRHNLPGKSPRDIIDVPTPRPRAKTDEKTFAEKRKESLLSRARGGKVPEVEVAVTAVMFAAKLKRMSTVTATSTSGTDTMEKKKKERVPYLPPRTPHVPLAGSPRSLASRPLLPACRARVR